MSAKSETKPRDSVPPPHPVPDWTIKKQQCSRWSWKLHQCLVMESSLLEQQYTAFKRRMALDFSGACSYIRDLDKSWKYKAIVNPVSKAHCSPVPRE